MTTTPEEGYELAIKLSRVAVKKTQPNNDVREKLRPVYENDSDALISVSHVVAVNFQTISAANNYWRE
jgi:hypothetical protein